MKFNELYLTNMDWHSDTILHTYIGDHFVGDLPVWSFFKHHFSQLEVEAFLTRGVILIPPKEREEEYAF